MPMLPYDVLNLSVIDEGKMRSAGRGNRQCSVPDRSREGGSRLQVHVLTDGRRRRIHIKKELGAVLIKTLPSSSSSF